jgi:hypothetical protein
MFWKLDCSHPQVKMWEVPTLLDSWERAKLQWLRLILSNWPNRIGVSDTLLRTKTGPLSKTICSFASQTINKVQNLVILSNIHHLQNSLDLNTLASFRPKIFGFRVQHFILGTLESVFNSVVYKKSKWFI